MMMEPIDLKSEADIKDAKTSESCLSRRNSVCSCGCLRPRRVMQIFLPRRLDLYIFESDHERNNES